MQRREFLKICGGLMAGLIVQPVKIFVPPREPYIYKSTGLDNLYSHLGIFPVTKELDLCEGELLEIGEWDGVGYPCLVKNVCTFGKNPPQAWIYDFDLWNFRHDDHLPRMWQDPIGKKFPNHQCWHAYRRFGRDLHSVATSGGGMISRHLFPPLPSVR